MFVFVYPGIIQNHKLEAIRNDQRFVRNFMSQLGVGEVYETTQYGLELVLNSSHKIWTEKTGVKDGKRWALQRKFGSR